MKFETPKMEVAMFSNAHILTASGDEHVLNSNTVSTAVSTLTGNGNDVTEDNIFKFTF